MNEMLALYIYKLYNVVFVFRSMCMIGVSLYSHYRYNIYKLTNVPKYVSLNLCTIVGIMHCRHATNIPEYISMPAKMLHAI